MPFPFMQIRLAGGLRSDPLGELKRPRLPSPNRGLLRRGRRGREEEGEPNSKGKGGRINEGKGAEGER